LSAHKGIDCGHSDSSTAAEPIPAWKRVARLVKDPSYRLISAVERFPLWRPHGLVPPAHLRFYYYRSWHVSAFSAACKRARVEALHHGLAPEHRVLDIGSGIGNLPIGLLGYLRDSYEGVEIHPEAVAWCQIAITSKHPRFRFHHADLSSQAYNRGGLTDAAKYRFPFSDRDFDFIILASVFTHMLPDGVAHYIDEIARLLRPGGVSVASYFLLNDSTSLSVQDGYSFLPFPYLHTSGLARMNSLATPEAAVAIDETFVRRAYESAGLRVLNIRRGGWPTGVADDQDVITATPR